jgi:uncharacterized RDD family membrane protein YckC
MSDIPVGSPVPPPGRHAAPGGWYPDPVDPTQERYWDGWQWSRTTRPRENASHRAPYGSAGVLGTSSYPAGTAQRGYPGTAPVPTTQDGVPLAAWLWRVLAALVDNLITSVVVSVVAYPVWQSVYATFRSYFETLLAAQSSGGSPPPPPQLLVGTNLYIVTAVTLGVGVAYQVVFLRWRSATPGKLLCRLRVVPVDQGRFTGVLGWNTIGVRVAIRVMPGVNALLGSVLSLLVGMFAILDVLFPLWHPKRQALHDMAAKTQVVRIPPTVHAPGGGLR